MKRPNVSVYSQITLVFVSFTVVALLLMTFFQVAFSDDVYRALKSRAVRVAAHEIALTYEDGEYEEQAKYWNAKEQLSVYVVSADGERLLGDKRGGQLPIDLSTEQLREIYRVAVENDGEYMQHKEIAVSPSQEKGRMDGKIKEKPVKKPEFDKSQKKSEPKDFSGEILICARVIDSADTPCMALAVGVVTPLETTNDTLAVQMAIISVFVIGFALATALFTARHVAVPIVRVNAAAARLATGDYESPAVGGYHEIDQLCDTIDQVAVDLKKNEKLQRELIANVSHDLRTPLTMITGYGEAIRDLPGENSAENIQVVIDEAERLSRLVNDLLDLSRLQAGAELLHKTMLDVTQTVESTVERCRRMVEYTGYTIEFTSNEHVHVEADETRVQQIIYNLLGNALRFTGEDKTVVVTQSITDDTVSLSFTDSGKGIPPEEIGGIWNRYYQVHSGDAADTAMHSGLGLSIVYNLVKLHGGECSVESTVGKGTTFRVTLPIVKA